MKENWEKAEEIVRNLTGGWRTPGSGNQRLKGDVRTGASEWVLEVKQTDNTKIDLKSIWLDNLLKEAGKSNVGLVIFFGLSGVWFEYCGRASTSELLKLNKSLTLTKETVPIELAYKDTLWKRRDLEELRSLR